MARTFDNNAANHLTATDTYNPIMTMACWFKVVDVTANHTLMNYGDSGSASFERIAAMGGVGGDPLRVQSSGASDTSTGFTANTWHHACGVFGEDECAIYLDGGGAASGASRLPAGSLVDLDLFSIGLLNRSSPTQPANGAIAWATVWDEELTQAEAQILASGAHPYTVRPHAIISFYPLTGASTGGEIDAIGNTNLTENGTVGVAESNLVSLGWPINVTRTAAGGGGATTYDQAVPLTVTATPTIEKAIAKILAGITATGTPSFVRTVSMNVPDLQVTGTGTINTRQVATLDLSVTGTVTPGMLKTISKQSAIVATASPTELRTVMKQLSVTGTVMGTQTKLVQIAIAALVVTATPTNTPGAIYKFALDALIATVTAVVTSTKVDAADVIRERWRRLSVSIRGKSK